jgi:Domain of unknown function (DUF4338)
LDLQSKAIEEGTAMAVATEEIHCARLRDRIQNSLRKQGFVLRNNELLLPDHADKDTLRNLHALAVQSRIEQARPGLERHEPRLLRHIASGAEVVPERISPRLVEVEMGTENELLFRYARLHWSIPVSAGYGRRIRFLVIDDSNDRLIGIIGLGDPVYSLKPRDEWIGWSRDAKRQHIRDVMDAFVLGAVPPYSQLLCGKLVALLVASDEVREAVTRKYWGRHSWISETKHEGRLALITTTSALGRSSLYRRIRFENTPIYISVGFTRGSGEFQFANGVFEDLRRFAVDHCDATAKDARWGNGFRNRREWIRKALPKLGLPSDLVYHGIAREILVIPILDNAAGVLRGEESILQWRCRPACKLFAWFRERWLLPRARCDQRYRSFEPESYRLWRRRHKDSHAH